MTEPLRWLDADSEPEPGMRALLGSALDDAPTPAAIARLRARLDRTITSGEVLGAPDASPGQRRGPTRSVLWASSAAVLALLLVLLLWGLREGGDRRSGEGDRHLARASAEQRPGASGSGPMARQGSAQVVAGPAQVESEPAQVELEPAQVELAERSEQGSASDEALLSAERAWLAGQHASACRTALRASELDPSWPQAAAFSSKCEARAAVLLKRGYALLPTQPLRTKQLWREVLSMVPRESSLYARASSALNGLGGTRARRYYDEDE